MAEEPRGLQDVFAGGVAHGCRGNSEVVALYVLFMLREEPMQPSSVVDRLVGARGRREHHLIVGRLELFLVRSDGIVRQLAYQNLSRLGLLGFEMDDAKALGVGLNLLDIAEGRTNDILDATCSFP